MSGPLSGPHGVFTARFPGRCHADCGEPIEPGDDCTYAEDEVVHVGCADRVAVERPVVVCQTCWLTKPCGCEDPT